MTKRNPSSGFWSTGLTLKGSTSIFGIEIALESGWALITEDQSARLVHSYQYVNGAFQPAGTIARPQLPANTAFGYRIALSADGMIAAIAAFDYDIPGLAGDDHGIVYIYQRLADGTWTPIQEITAGPYAVTNGKFGSGRRLR